MDDEDDEDDDEEYSMVITRVNSKVPGPLGCEACT